jgi:hypothetical protein
VCVCVCVCVCVGGGGEQSLCLKAVPLCTVKLVGLNIKSFLSWHYSKM